jgi:thiamine transport system permease protein
LVTIIADGALAIHLVNKGILVALLKSISVATGAVIICLFITISLGNVIASNHTRLGVKWLMEGTGYFVIATSPLVIGTGLFIFLYPILNPTKFVLPITALVNAIMALPFSLRIILPAMQKINKDYGKLSDSIGLNGFHRFFKLTLPRLRNEIGFASGLIAALSIGDLGVVTLFSAPQSGTLPLTIYRLMGSYQMEAAKAAAFILLITCFSIFLLADKLGKSNASYK